MASESSLKGLLETATVLLIEGKLAEGETILDRIAAHPDRHVLGPETALGLPRRLHSAYLKLAKRKGDRARTTALQFHLIPPVDVLWPLFRITGPERASRVQAQGLAVPKELHQIWIGGTPPETTEIWKDHAARHGWSYALWDEVGLARIGVGGDPVFQHMIEKGDMPGAVDVARYHVLAAQGGLYLDCDWMPVRDEPFETVIPNVGLSTIAETTPRLTGSGSPFLNNSVIAAPPEHPVFRQLLQVLPRVLEALPKGPAWWVTGPLVFTLACRAGPVTVLDAELTAGETLGGRAELDTALTALRAERSAYLHEWKSWVFS